VVILSLAFTEDLKDLFNRDLRSIYSSFRSGEGYDVLVKLGETRAVAKLKKYEWKNDIADKEFLVRLLDEIGFHKEPDILFNGGVDSVEYSIALEQKKVIQGVLTIENRNSEEFPLNLHRYEVSSSRVIIVGKSITDGEITLNYEIVPGDNISSGLYTEHIIIHTNYKTYILHIILHCKEQNLPKHCLANEIEDAFYDVNSCDPARLLAVILKLRHEGRAISTKTFLNLMKKAEKEEYFHVILGVLYEEFIVKYGIATEYGARFLANYYKINKLNTVFCFEVLKIVNLFFNENEVFNTFFLYKCLCNNEFGVDFYNVFKRYYQKRGPADKLVVDCVNKLVHYEYYHGDFLLDILTRVYEYDKSNIRLLEEIVWWSLQKGKYIRQYHLITLVNHYIKYRILSDRSREILLKALKKGIRGIEPFMAETLKYEFFYTGDNLVSHTLEYWVPYTLQWCDLQIEENKTYALLIGYCHVLKYRFKSCEENDIKNTQRDFIERNEYMILDIYDGVADVEFRAFAAEICLMRNINNRKILSNASKGTQNKAEAVLEFLKKNKTEESMRSASMHLSDYFDSLLNNGMQDDLYNLILRLSDLNLKASIEFIERLGTRKNDNRIKNLIKSLIQRVANNYELEELKYLVHYITDNDTDGSWGDYAIYYVRGIDFPSKAETCLVAELYKSYQSTDTGALIENELLAKTESAELSYMLQEMYKITGSSRLNSKLAALCLEYPQTYNRETILAALDVYKRDKGKLKKLANRYGSDSVVAAELYNIAELYVFSDFQFSKELLEGISHHSAKARSALNRIRDANKLIGSYYLVREVEREAFGAAFEARDIFSDRRIEAVAVEPDISEALDRYLIVKNNVGIKKEKDFYFMECNYPMAMIDDSITIKDRLKIINDLIELEEILSDSGYIFIHLDLEQVALCDGIPFPIKPYYVHEFSCLSKTSGIDEENSSYTQKNTPKFTRVFEDLTYPIHKQLKKKEQNSTYMDIYEEDLVEIILFFARDLLSINVGSLESKVYNQVKLILEEKKLHTLKELKYKIYTVIERIENGFSKDFDVKRAIMDFEIMDEKKQQEIVAYIIKEEISTRQAYSIALQNQSLFEDSNWKCNYLLKYIKKEFDNGNDFMDALLLSKVLVKEGDKLSTAEGELRNNCLSFIKNCIRYKVLNIEEVRELIERIKFLTPEEKATLIYFVELKEPCQ
jgi:hypothetical protein